MRMVLLLSTLAAVVVITAAAAADRPNLLLILADDLGYGDVRCYNSESKIPTLHLDQLAREGMRFTDAHSPSTVCTPSRCSLLTGRMCFRTGLRGVFTGVDGPLIEKGRLTLPQMLRNHGYRTACVGKWHVGMTFFRRNGQPVASRGGGIEKVRQVDFTKPFRDGPTDVGFDYFFGTASCPTTDWLYAYLENDRVVEVPTEWEEPVTDHWLEYEHFRPGLKAPGFEFRNVDLVFLEKSIGFLEKHAREQPDRPFFLYHATQTAHLPALPAQQFIGKSQAGPLGDFIVEFDEVVGELLKTLDRLKLSDNTLVIVTSDNGPEIIVTHLRDAFGHKSAGPWRGFKRDNWEGGHRVPFLARWPGKIEPGSVSDQTICLTDIMATCAAIVGAKLPKDAGEDSFNLLPALLAKTSRDEGRPVREFTLHQTVSNALAIRRGPWKYLDHPGSGGNDYATERLQPYALPQDASAQLYNLADDPGETTNHYSRHSEIVSQLKGKLEEFKASGRSAPLIE